MHLPLQKLKIKESFHIEQLKPDELNKQKKVEHVNLALHF